LRVALSDERQTRDAFSTFSESVWQKLRRYRAEQRLGVWAHRLAFAAAKQQRLASQAKRTTRKGRSGGRELSRTRAATIEPVGAAEDAEIMRRELSLEEQTLLTLRIDRGYTWAEISWLLGQGAGREAGAAVCRRYERLVRRLHAAAITRGLIEPGPIPANLGSLQLARKSASRDG
jgi:RNA polymerase sigma-70 factor (ECF subfamily)